MAAIAIIGGGLSGALTALHLIRMNSATPLRMYIINRSTRIGPGLAYSTDKLCHRLNVRAHALSVFADDPDHFVRWLSSHGGNGDAGEFALRRSFGHYVEDTLRMHGSPHGLTTLHVINDEAVGCTARDDGATVFLGSGGTIEVQYAVVAVGNFPPTELPPFEKLHNDSRYVRDPWVPGAMEKLSQSSRLLFVGTGLTMVDVALGLQELGCTGRMMALSTHGRLPAVHTAPHSYPDFYDEMCEEPSVAHMVRTVRRHVENAARSEVDMQAVIDSLRPHIQSLWLMLPVDERRRFLRHVRHYWESVRHRMAPQCRSAIEQMVQSQQLHITGGRITGVVPHDDTISVRYRRRGARHDEEIEVEGIVNCTGPAHDYSRINHPLIADMIQQGTLCCDPLHLGIHALPDGRLVDRNGTPSDVLYTIGPPLRGVLWETTAVREIREQARTLAALLISSVASEAIAAN